MNEIENEEKELRLIFRVLIKIGASDKVLNEWEELMEIITRKLRDGSISIAKSRKGRCKFLADILTNPVVELELDESGTRV